MNCQSIREALFRSMESHKEDFRHGKISGPELGKLMTRIGRICSSLGMLHDRKERRKAILEKYLPRLTSMKEKDLTFAYAVNWMGDEETTFTFHIYGFDNMKVIGGENALAEFREWAAGVREVVVMWDRDYFFSKYGYRHGVEFTTSNYDITQMGRLFTRRQNGTKGFFSDLVKKFSINATGVAATYELAMAFHSSTADDIEERF